MRNFDATLYAELQKEILTMFFMLEFQLQETTWRFVDADVDIYYEGNRFYSRPFRFENLAGSSAMSVDNLDIEIDDTDQAVSQILCSQDVRNRTAIMYFGVVANQEVTGAQWDTNISWDQGVKWQDTYYAKRIIIEEFMRFIIGGWELRDDNTARIMLTNELILWNKPCLRNQSASCLWPFKSTECGYTGSATWCDHSYERCKALGNQINYPGNRFLPALIKQELWWGRTPNYGS